LSHDPFTFIGDSGRAGEGRFGPGIPPLRGLHKRTAQDGFQAVKHRISISVGAFLALLLGQALAPLAAEDNVRQAAIDAPGKSSQPLPRFVSLKSDKVNVRKGPSTDQAIVWVFSRAGLPVEVIAESDNWRRVRDSEGADGWVFHSLLSARRTALVTPWAKGEERVPLYSSNSTGSRAVAELQAGVLGNVLSCDGEWCNVSVDDYSGYVQQDKLWGVYKGEEVK
jgi:SH3-like domain-containing protein